MPYETVSPDDAHSILYGTSPRESIVVQPSQQENVPVAPKKELKKEKKTEAVVPPSLAQQVTNTMDLLENNTPAPVPTSPVPQITDTVGDLLNTVKQNWMPMAIPVVAYGAYKLGKNIADGEPKPASPTTPIADRQIVKIEPQMDVNQQPQGRVEPTFEQPKAMPTSSSGELPNDVLNSPGYKAFTALEEKSGGPITTATDLKMIQQSEANRIAKEKDAFMKAQQAGVTPSTSPQEAQTLITTSEAAKDTIEKAQEKVTFAEPSKEVKGAVAPKSASKIKEVPEGMSIMEGAAGPTNWMYNTHKGRYNSIINEFNQGQHPKTMEEAYALDKMFRAKYGGLNRGPNIPTDIAIERGIPAPEPGGRLGKVVSHAGKLGILASIADIANAAQAEKKGSVLSGLYDIATNLGVSPALAFHAGGLNSNEERELAQRRKIGGGRGVAPAGMGQR
jgi:hypothetical protein